jgi:hypothetical protein
LRPRSQTALPLTKPMRPFQSFALILFTAASVAGAQTSSPTLEERMSQTEFSAAGLDKLSPQELQQLNAWLETHGSANVKYVSPDGAPVFYPDSDERTRIESSIAGAFRGWRGKTVFTLENGQQWQQAESGAFDTREIDSPGVKIKPMMMGGWLMYVDRCGCELRVKRVK